MIGVRQISGHVHVRACPRFLYVALLALALAAVMTGCSGGSGSTSESANVPLSQVSWCDRPLISFQDDSATTQTTFTDWSKVRDQLGFTPYLPATLPHGSCLVVAGGSIHNPIFGGQFSITYNLSLTGPLSFSEAPKRQGLNNQLQCTTSTSDAKTTICLGAISDTSVTVASHQSQKDMQALFKSLKANVNWVPGDTKKILVTSTPSPTSHS